MPSLFKTVISSLGSKVTVTGSSVRCIVLYKSLAVGASVSIQSTVISLVPTLPNSSANLNSYDALASNVIVLLPSTGFSVICTSCDKIVIFSLSNVIVATTSWFVSSVVLKLTSAWGGVLSIQSTRAVALPVRPSSSTNSKVNSPFSVKV